MWYPIILQRSLEEELMKRKGLLANEEDLEEIKVVRSGRKTQLSPGSFSEPLGDSSSVTRPTWGNIRSWRQFRELLATSLSRTQGRPPT